MIDATRFILGNLQSIFLPTKTKRWFMVLKLKCPSSVKELVPFENDMINMIKNLEFKRANNEFRSNLRSYIRQIRKSNNLFVSETNLGTYTK